MEQETPPISSSKQALFFLEVERGLGTRVRLIDRHWPVPIGYEVQTLGRRKSYAEVCSPLNLLQEDSGEEQEMPTDQDYEIGHQLHCGKAGPGFCLHGNS